MKDCFKRGSLRILGTSYYPEGRGKIERFFRFVQMWSPTRQLTLPPALLVR